MTKEYYEAHKAEILADEKKKRDANPEKYRAKHKAYYEAHRDEILMKSAIWYKNNTERKKEYDNRYNEINRENIRSKNKSYYELNREKCISKAKEYCARNPGSHKKARNKYAEAHELERSAASFFNKQGLSIRQVPTELVNLKIQHITLIREIRSKKEALNV